MSTRTSRWRSDCFYATLRPEIQPARIKKIPGCPRKLPTPSTRYWTEVRVQYMQLSSILRSLPSRRTICGVVPGFFFIRTAVRSSLMVPTQNLVVFQFRKGKKLTSLMQNIIAILKIGTKLGFIAGTLPLMEKILCRVTALTGLAMATRYLYA